MFNSDRKKRLKEAKAGLEAAGSNLSPRAKAFRRTQADILRDIDDALRSVFPDGSLVESLVSQADELIRLAPRLNKLCDGTVGLEEQVDELRQAASQQDDAEIAASIDGRCNGWLGEL